MELLTITTFIILSILLISKYDSYTTPTEVELKEIRTTSKIILKQIKRELITCTSKKGIELLIERKRIILEIYKLSKKGVKGSTIAYLVEESADLGIEYVKATRYIKKKDKT